MTLKPLRLTKGDTVGIIAPSSPPVKEDLQRSLSFLDDLGLKVKFGKHLFNEYGYLAGRDEERLEDLHTMIQDQDVRAIICARGGYGTARFASSINYELIRQNPKIIWGYSDITFLHTAIYEKTGLVTFHGPMLASDIGKEDVHPLSKQFFHQLFQPTTITYSENISPLETIVEGDVTGTLVGGNLTLLTSTLATPYELDTKGKVLLIEDIHEEPRSIDRMLNQLWMAGKLDDAVGILVGDFHECDPDPDSALSLEEVLHHYIQKVQKPALSGFHIGHCSPNIGIPLGVQVCMNTFEKKVIIENGVI